MALDTKILATVRGSYQPIFAEGSDEQPQLNTRGELLVSQGLPPLATLVNAGNSYMASTTTAAAPVVAIPTTAALIGLWNGEAANGKSYIIDSIFVIQTAVTAAVQNVGILVNVALQPVLTALANTITPRNLRSTLGYRGMGRVAVGITLDATNGIAANWFPVGTTPSAQNTLQIGTTVDVNVNGMFVIPPGGQIALTALAGAATATSVQIGLRWHEVVLPPAV